ncbi:MULTISPECIES: helix-turn-helix transcriptional regulator [Streptomyces]|uniref:Helix-turn-helix domain-containing protein n=1 Tax=Streptomyces odorifer TaxID=53450 RepID=A0A7Y6KJR3_9ACTN|nr:MULTISPECIES: helix-turn-helix transcriptional regulator [Streptomyces]NUV36543.1 helix-turn-helix domain-containing protein [Streptomyces sp. KAI-27]NUV49790.1 helix-turn-helix domain-containing protein [Streptomyces sp. CAI-78]MBL0801417.1 helix-turn-helix domain-containing protein [Streptomyces albidoflavus]MCK2142698.1 helix-turn-helix domain-containing protein [Streptomyces sp. WAC00276]MCQ9706435.1 helix-turn-helix domain-containing protein [Streptomyces sp. BSP1]
MVNRKELNPESSPRAAFGALVRSSREERGWTQDELADATEYSSTHISAIETSRKPPTLRFSRSIDRALGTGDQFERKFREVKQGVLLEGFPEYLGYEARAAEIRVFEIGIIPGLLQTQEYARVLTANAVQRGAISPEQASERVRILAERQDALIRQRPPMVFVTMDESCIRRPIGGHEVMEGQLEHLAEFARMPNTMLQIAPFEIGERRTLDRPVNLLTLSDRSMIYYAESQAQGHLEREGSDVIGMLTAYHQLQAEALSQAASVALINQLRKGSP